MRRVLAPVARRPFFATAAAASPCVLPATAAAAAAVAPQRRWIKVLSPPNVDGPLHYKTGLEAHREGGRDVSVQHTEFYDGYTDDFGVHKEGPPVTMRLEYVRSLDHVDPTSGIYTKWLWSPFELPQDTMCYSKFYQDTLGTNSLNYYGHRRDGPIEGMKRVGFYRRKQWQAHDMTIRVNYFPQLRTPKWLASIANDRKSKMMVGFFVYADGSFCAECLTYKQLPRLVYNKPFEGHLPTLGQRVTMGEVTYGKELHSLQEYAGDNHGGLLMRHNGCFAIVLRCTEPNMVALMLPNKEVRLWDTTALATFGRRAGVLSHMFRWDGMAVGERYRPKRRQIRTCKRNQTEHSAGGTGRSRNAAKLILRTTYRDHWIQYKGVSKYWLQGYQVRTARQNKRSAATDVKAESYSFASRDPVYVNFGSQ